VLHHRLIQLLLLVAHKAEITILTVHQVVVLVVVLVVMLVLLELVELRQKDLLAVILLHHREVVAAAAVLGLLVRVHPVVLVVLVEMVCHRLLRHHQ
jgi:hypothetical protein